jgi:cytochrome c-type biogenesis protein CcmE
VEWKNEKNRSKKWIFGGGLILLLVMAFSFYAMQNYSVYFYTPKELFEKADELGDSQIRVGGMVKTSSVHWDPQALNLQFVLSDLKGVEIPVSYSGAPPDMFKEGSGVVVEGALIEGELRLRARNLFVKHSEEYRIPEEGHKINPALIEQSIIKNQKE